MRFILTTALLCTSSIYGAVYDWQGTGSAAEFSLGTNWDPVGPPGGADTGNFFFFPGVSTDPVLSNFLVITGLSFTDDTNFTFEMNNTLSNSGGGFENLGSGTQTFNSNTNFGGVAFSNGASADITNSANVFFNIINGAVTFALGANAGSAIFTNADGVDFNLSSSAASSIITNTGTVTFRGSSTAGSAFITNNGGVVNFVTSATGGDATINSSGGQINFSSGGTGGNAALSLSGGALVQVFGVNNITLGSLESDASGIVAFLGVNDLTVGSNDLSTTFAGSASGGGGSITKVGEGTLTVSGTNLYTGPTTVNGGVLSLTGSIAGDFVVNAGGTSNGTGVVGGSYTQNADSFFLVNTNGFLDVTGPVTLNGGEVLVADSTFPLNAPFLILHSDVSRTGVYDGVTSLNPYFFPSLSYDAQNVYLTLGTQFQAFALTVNEAAVASALDSIESPTAEQAVLIAALASLTVPEFLDALNQLSGEQYANLVILNERTNRRFLRQIYDPFRPDFASCNRCCYGNFVGWISAQGGQSFLRGDENAQGFRQYDVDVSLGVHRYFLSSLALGIAGNYEYDHVSFNQSGTGNATNFQGAVYGIYEHPLGYLFGEVAGGYTYWKMKRELGFDSFFATATSTPKISHVATYGELGVNLRTPAVLVQPFIGLDYSHYWRSGVEESGAGVASLFIHSQNYNDFETRLGAHITSTYGILLLSADAAWRHRYTTLNDETLISFISFGPEFTIIGPAQNRDAFEGALYLAAPVLPTVTAYIEASGEVWNRFASYGITVGLQRVW